MSIGFALRRCTLTDVLDDAKKLPIGVNHANDGIATPDGFQWAHKMTHWFAVQLLPNVGAIQIMSWSRLAKSLKWLDRTEPAERDGYGEDTVNYTGPLGPPLDLPYELTWRDKRAVYPLDSSFQDIPKLEHRIQLPEMLYVENCPRMYSSVASWPKPVRTEFFRIHPPPKHLFEEERLKATVHFSKHDEFTGRGHWSFVFRVRMEHPAFTAQLKKKQPDSETKNEAQSSLEQVDPTPEAGEDALFPFKRYSREFYHALLQYYCSLVREGGDGSEASMNFNPDLSDEEYERYLRENGEFGVPWWTIHEVYMHMSSQKKDSGKKDDKKEEEANEEKEKEEENKNVDTQPAEGKAGGEEKADEEMVDAQDADKQVQEPSYEDVEMALPERQEPELGSDGHDLRVPEPLAELPQDYVPLGFRLKETLPNGTDVFTEVLTIPAKQGDQPDGEAKVEKTDDKCSRSSRKSEAGKDDEEGGSSAPSMDEDVEENEEALPKPRRKPVLIRYGPFGDWLASAMSEPSYSMDNEPDTFGERVTRSHQVLFFSDIDTKYNAVIERMLGKPVKVPSSPEQQSGASFEPDEWETVQLPVTVLAKLPFKNSDALHMIMEEGKNYGLMPDYLSEARQGYIQTKPIQQPQPCAAVIPKFYGMYQAKDGRVMLLMEECGEQVSSSRSLKTVHKNQIISLSVRLHRFGMLQNSPYIRNVVRQPGPLTVPPSSRSLDCPSFRIIDFGRGEYTPKDDQDADFCKDVDYEETRLASDMGWANYMPAGRIWPNKQH